VSAKPMRFWSFFAATTVCASDPIVFVAIGSFDETHAWRRTLARRTYLRTLSPRQEYIFSVHSASAAELADLDDVVLVPPAALTRCRSDSRVATKRCRSGATFATGLRWAAAYSTAPYVLSVDDDGFLCTTTVHQFARSLVYQPGTVIGTWHEKNAHPDQNFVLLSRDVASNASRQFDAHPRNKAATLELASFFRGQTHAYDARNVVLHPRHNALARMYQRLEVSGRYFRAESEAFCDRHMWIHLCCSSRAIPELWEDLQGDAEGSSHDIDAIAAALDPLSPDVLRPRNFSQPPRVIETESCGACKMSEG